MGHMHMAQRKCIACDGLGGSEVRCGTCNGSGEGMWDGSRCASCKGMGDTLVECDVCDGHGNEEYDETEQDAEGYQLLDEDEVEQLRLLRARVGTGRLLELLAIMEDVDAGRARMAKKGHTDNAAWLRELSGKVQYGWVRADGQ